MDRDRIASAAAVAACHALLGYALLTGLGIDAARKAGATLKLFEVSEAPPPPPPAPPPPAPAASAPEGAAAPAGLRAEASPIVAPVPEVRMDIPPPFVAAPVPGIGSEKSQGASPLPGPGTGAGGEGSGTGSGGAGTGSGGGGVAIKAKRIRGEITGRDYPRAAKRANAGGTVLTRYTIAPDGRVTDCTVTQSSGHAELDAVSCRLVMQRYLFAPARDSEGRPVADTIMDRHIWWTEPRD